MFIRLPKIKLRIKTKRIIKGVAVIFLISAWILTSYPAVLIPGLGIFPPKIREAHAATIVIFITATNNAWTVPSDWSDVNTIEIIGGGGAGATGTSGKAGGGGGGGAYTKATNVTTITPGSTVKAVVGAGGATSGTGGGDTYFCNSTSGTNCIAITGSDVVAGAKGGGGGTASGNSTTSTTAPGGDAASCTGFGTPTCYSGGAGGKGDGGGDSGGGGGGAAGKTGIGKTGGAGQTSTSGGAGGGGGANAGSSTVGNPGTSTQGGVGGIGPGGQAGGSAGVNGSGGNATLGAGGGGADTGATFVGGNGGGGVTEWTQTSPSQNAGAGGGGGGAGNSGGNGGNGGLYGGGGGGGEFGFGTGANGIIVITYAQDATAPTPNPMTFSSAPSNTSTSQIDMTASQASDTGVGQAKISYLFTLDTTACTAANIGTGGDSSSWQLNTLTYSDTGLQTNKCYGYKVQAKDQVGNTTTASSITTLYTSAAVPGTPTLGSPSTSTLALTNAENGNPGSNPTTNFAVQVTTTSPTDSTWLNKWVNASGDSSASEVWMTDAQLDALVLRGLLEGTTYGVKVKARNNDNDETALSAEGQGTTSTTATATFTQNKYRWYYDNDSINPVTVWGLPVLAENTAIGVIPAGKDPPDTLQELRLRVNMVVNTAALSATQKYFKLEYKTGTDGSCTSGSWTDVGTGVWTYAISGVTNGGNITAVLSDTTSGKGEQYVKAKPSALNNTGASIGGIVEYDFHIIGGTAVANTTYSFRVVNTDSGGTAETVLDAYTNCPTLTTEPGMANLLRHGQVFTNAVKQGFFWTN